jgi:hypothetical protein
MHWENGAPKHFLTGRCLLLMSSESTKVQLSHLTAQQASRHTTTKSAAGRRLQLRRTWLLLPAAHQVHLEAGPGGLPLHFVALLLLLRLIKFLNPIIAVGFQRFA